jgi:hypothetical protein
MPTIEDRFKIRRGTATDLASVNEVPLKGEFVWETDQGLVDGKYKLKIGDGVTHYNDLAYLQLGGGVETITPGSGVAVDSTDPKNPVVSSTLGSIALSGNPLNYAALPSGLTSGDSGKAYLLKSDNLIYIWNGSSFPASGSGVSPYPPTDVYAYATTCLIQTNPCGLLDRALPGRWQLSGNATIDAVNGVDFGTTGFLYKSVPELIGASDFTVEGVFKPSSVTGTRELFAWSDGTATSTATLFSLFLEITAGKLRATLRNGGASNADFTTASTVVSAGTEYHIAVTVSATTMTIWVNGSNVGSATLTGTRGTGQSNLRIGQLQANDLRQFSGKMKAFRVTSGVARYTSSFTPRVLPWPFL